MRTLSIPAFAATLLMAAHLLGPTTVAQEPAISVLPPGRLPLPLQQIVANLEARNAQRATSLAEFEGDRIYRMEYRGFFGNRDAEMVVKVIFRAPNDKEFKIISQSGSRFVIDHVFKKLIESEEEYSRTDNRQQNSITPANYDFELVGYENSPEGGAYILNLLPKTKNKFLYRGRIWVDSKDFAVTRIEGEPAKNPSMWIKKTSIAHRYTKVDGFWFPAENHTESLIRLGGTATLSIEYQNYKITKAPVRAVRKNSQVGDPSLLDGRLASVATTP